MSDRQRTTWPNDGDRTAEVLPVERAASAHPATPDEGAAHPANQPDPGEHDYENGDTSSWAEDPTTGPYPNSAHPATPDEGPAHPAHKQADAATAKEAATQLRAAVSRKASKTVRIAEALLIPLMRRAGIDPTSEKAASVIENQALDFLDLPDEYVMSTLNRLAGLAKFATDDEDADDEADEKEAAKKKAAEEEEEVEVEEETEASKKAADEALLRRLLAEEDGEDEDDNDDGEEAGKSAADRLADDRLAQILEAVQGLGGRLTALETGKPVISTDDEDADDEDADEALLAQMLNQEAAISMDETPDDVEAMLQSMVVEDDMFDDEVEVEVPVDTGFNELDVQMGDFDDPMGLMEETELTAEESRLLGTLFASDGTVNMTDTVASDSNVDPSLLAAATADANKEAAERKPRAKKASSGVTSLGHVAAAGSGNAEIDELSKLWPTAPDVSNVFG